MDARIDTLNAKSTHLFAWPFKFQPQSKKDFALKDIDSQLANLGWQRNVFFETAIEKTQVEADVATSFMLQQYLSTSACDIFMPKKEQGKDKDALCQIYTYPEELEKYEYLITPNGKPSFRLPITCVELHVYKHEVGILWIQLANHAYNDIDDMKLINDLGRRISLPFIPGEPTEEDKKNNKESIMLCAEEIGIVPKGQATSAHVTAYRDLSKKLAAQPDLRATLQEPAGFLLDLLYCHIGTEKSAAQTASDCFDVRAFADDRMFTFCVIRDDALSGKLKDMDLANDPALVDTLYQIAYVDPDNSSCPNAAMQRQLLERALYPRWSAWGTVHLLTSYSMICITGTTPNINDSVVKPFLVEYAYCISLVLSQRMGISEFSIAAGNVVQGLEGKGVISKQKVKELINLQEKYITFKNQMLILEFTSQEQGIELYALLQAQLLIQKEQAILDEQLESLYEVTNVSNSNRLNSLALWFALAAIAVDLGINIVCSFFYGDIAPHRFLFIGICVALVAFFALFAYQTLSVWCDKIWIALKWVWAKISPQK